MSRSNRSRTPRVIAVAAAALLSVAACSSSSDDTSSTSAAAAETGADPVDSTSDPVDTTVAAQADTTEAPADSPTTVAEERTASDIGVTADTITIAMIGPDTSSLPDLPIILKTDLPEYGYQLFVDDINARGGINGRQIEVETFDWNPFDIPASLDAICLAAGDDAEVFVGITTSFFGDAAACLMGDKGLPMLLAGGLPQDVVDRSNGNAFVLQGVSEELNAAAIKILAAEGKFTTDTIAIVRGTEPGQAEQAEAATALFEELGITATTYEVKGSALGGDPSQDVAAQKIQSDGIEFVFPLINSPNTASMMSAADLIGWTPTWVLNDASEKTSLITVNNAPASQLANVIGVSSVITGFAADGSLSPVAEECVEFRNSIPGAPPIEGGSPTALYVHSNCVPWRTLEKILIAAGTNPTRAGFAEAAAAIGSFDGENGGSSSFGPGKPGAPDNFRLVEYSPTCPNTENGCILPVGDWIDAPK